MKSTFILFLVILSLEGCSLRPIEDIRQSSPIVKRTTDLVGGTVLLPPTVPDRSSFTPVGYFTISVDAQTREILVLYSRPYDKKIATYFELYDQEGRLLLIRWVEKSGVTKTAIDLGVLDKDGSEPIGILVLVVEGHPA